MSKRWDLESHMRCRLAAWPEVPHVKREVAELKALKAVGRAAKAADKARHRFAQHRPGSTWDYWIDKMNDLTRALARLDKLTKETP